MYFLIRLYKRVQCHSMFKKIHVLGSFYKATTDNRLSLSGQIGVNI